jgi:hypothetical protein
MKNQYFADINDLRKYGLLRALSDNGRIKTAVCWMLTDNDTRTDGNFIGYLDHSEKWRQYDPALFDTLAACMSNPANRSVQWAEANNLIPSAVYFPELLRDDPEERRRYFAKFQTIAADCDLVFFDPDNGLQVKSVSYGRRNSNKYLFWPELIKTFASGKSILLYQHFIRVKRELFIQRLVDRLSERLPMMEVYALTTANVIFLLIPQPDHQSFLAEKCAEISRDWCPQIKLSQYRCASYPLREYSKT